MISPFILRVGSGSEDASVEFALRLLGCIETLSARSMKPLQLITRSHESDIPFRDILSWDWPSAPSRLRELSATGIDTILLSERFLDWDTPRYAINEGLYAFEDSIASLGINILQVESYSDRQRDKLPVCFRRVNRWHSGCLADILDHMMCDFSRMSLVSPYGCVPYFLLDPAVNLSRSTGTEQIRALVGFQPWQYAEVLTQWPTTEFSFRHTLQAIKGEPVRQDGPMPLVIPIGDRFTNELEDI